MPGNIYHSWNGTVLTITSDSGTNSMNLKGDDGCRGPQGPAGGAINDVSLIDKTLTIENYAADAKAVGDMLTGAKITDTKQGEIIAIDEAANAPLQGLKIYGKSQNVLSNVGSDGAVSITVCGKNLFDFQKGVSLITYTTSAGAVAEKYGYDIHLPAGTYSLKAYGTNTNSYIYGLITDADGNTKQNCSLVVAASYTPQTITIDDGDIIKIYNGVAISTTTEAGSNYIFARFNIQIEAGDTHTAYEPYKATTFTIPTPNGLAGITSYTNASDVAKFCDAIDLANGVYVKRCEVITFDGTEDWRKSSSYNCYVLGSNICSKLANFYVDANYGSFCNVLCNQYEPIPYVASAEMPDKTIVNYMGNDGHCILIKDEAITTIEDWKANLAQLYADGTPLQILIPLNNTTETPIDADTLEAFAALYSNKGNTSIYADAGTELIVDYVVDAKTYIDKRFNALTNAIISLGGNV